MITVKTWTAYTRLLLLPAVTAILSVGCAPVNGQGALVNTGSDPISTPEQRVVPADDVAIAPGATDPDLAQHSPEQDSLPDIITGMVVGMPYAEARALIDQDIWAPKTHPPLDYVSTSVQTMRDLGYEEVRDCAGTGLGLCRLEFIEREGLVLVIIVTTAEAEPMVWSWGVE